MKKLILIAITSLVNYNISLAQQFLPHNLLHSNRLVALLKEAISFDADGCKDLMVSKRIIVSPRTLLILGNIGCKKSFGRCHWLGIP